MVAATGNSGAPRQLAEVPPSLLTGRGGIVRFTVDDVQAMIRQGILPEDSTTELLNGIIVLKDRSDLGGEPLVHGPKHRTSIRRLTALAAKIDSETRHAQIQLPVVCFETQMPEPDFAIIRGKDDNYDDQLPTAADAYMVLEVADSSLERDQGEKLATYGAAGIPQYVILNLRNSTAEQYTDPDTAAATYRTKTTFAPEQTIAFLAGPDGVVEIAVRDILP